MFEVPRGDAAAREYSRVLAASIYAKRLFERRGSHGKHGSKVSASIAWLRFLKVYLSVPTHPASLDFLSVQISVAHTALCFSVKSSIRSRAICVSRATAASVMSPRVVHPCVTSGKTRIALAALPSLSAATRLPSSP